MKNISLLGLLMIAFAVLQFLDLLDIYTWDWLFDQPWTEYAGPATILYLGVSYLFDDVWKDHDKWLQRPIPVDSEGKRLKMAASMGGDEYIYNGERFHGADIDATFGGIRLDLRGAEITEDEEIDIHTFMGGVEVYVPAGVNVVVKSRSFIGGLSNETSRVQNKGQKTLHISASNILGGVRIMN